MLKRILTSLVAIAVLLPVLYFSDTVVFPIAVSVVGLISLYEMFKCIGFERRWSVILPIYLFSAILPFAMRYLHMQSAVNFGKLVFIVAALYLVYLFARVVWSHGTLTFSDAAVCFTLSLYIIAALSSILYVRDYGESGKYIYLLIFIGAWVTDIFAYFTGFFFGKHKLIEDVSPKKTIEGSIGGIIFCSLGFVALGLIVDVFFGQDANLIFLAVSGVVISIISQIGDLIMSVIKRHYQIKDFGKLFPGHGGMLDRFDSIMAVSLGLCAVCMFASIMGISLM